MLGRRCAEKQSISVNDTDAVVASNWIILAPSSTSAVIGQRQTSMRMATPVVPVLLSADDSRRVMDAVTPLYHSQKARSAVDPRLFLLSLDSIPVETTSPSAVATQRLLLRIANR